MQLLITSIYGTMKNCIKISFLFFKESLFSPSILYHHIYLIFRLQDQLENMRKVGSVQGKEEKKATYIYDPFLKSHVMSSVNFHKDGEGQEGGDVAKRSEDMMNKWVISFGLYGEDPKYMEGAIQNAILIRDIFPDWVARFYVLDSVDDKVLDSLVDLGAEIVMEPSSEGSIVGMFWRFVVADDPSVERYMIRDVDSRLNYREALAVEEWIQSGRKVLLFIISFVCHFYKTGGV